ncbi:uncharacterized protein RHO25_013176 [Cercospora beticola]|uniref:Uncharacterized protein n=1 Tax=Cercospora beticola TaxID=122368 RepID=A0ABZ0P9S7_CERBT|nr:hypothetical protein RHO25_013176 [Cercospora beticola]
MQLRSFKRTAPRSSSLPPKSSNLKPHSNPQAPELTEPSKSRIVAIDYDTSKFDVCLWIGTAGKDPQIGDITVVLPNIPQKLAFDNRSFFHWEEEVDDLLSKKQLDFSQVCTNIKLLIFPDHSRTHVVLDRHETSGARTCEIVFCEIAERSEDDSTLQVKATDHTLGESCGSDNVNESFYSGREKFIARSFQSKSEILEQLRISEAEFNAKVTNEIDELKRRASRGFRRDLATRRGRVIQSSATFF